MRDSSSLLIGIGSAALIAVVGCFAIVLVGIWVWPSMAPRDEEALGVTIAFLPTAVATWWFFRRLQPLYSKQEARLVAVIFAVITPISLIIAFACAQIPAGYVGYLGRPMGLLGAFFTSVLIVMFLSVVPCVFVLRIRRRILKNSAEH